MLVSGCVLSPGGYQSGHTQDAHVRHPMRRPTQRTQNYISAYGPSGHGTLKLLPRICHVTTDNTVICRTRVALCAKIRYATICTGT